MIIRTEKKANYTVLDNHHIKDKRLTLAARGIMEYMLSKPNNWQFDVETIAADFDEESEYSINKALKELEKKGYLERKRHRNIDGTLGKMEYILYETPTYMRNTKIGKTKVGKPTCEIEGQASSYKVNTNKLNTNKKKSVKKDTPSKDAYGKFNNVFLTDQELEEFREMAGWEWKRRIERLSLYLKQSGKNYKSHYATLLDWLNKDWDKEINEMTGLDKEEVEEIFNGIKAV